MRDGHFHLTGFSGRCWKEPVNWKEIWSFLYFYEQNLSKKEKDDWIYPPVGVCFDMAPIFFEVIVLLY